MKGLVLEGGGTKGAYQIGAFKALRELGWKAEKNLDDMCRDSWRWQKNNPNGYDN